MSWQRAIKYYEDYFGAIELPIEPIRIGSYTITDIKAFIYNHLETLKHNEDIETFLVYGSRLKELKEYLDKTVL